MTDGTKEDLMTITVNGKVKELTTPLTVEELLASLELDAARVAVERNRDILPKSRFAATTLNDGDRLEIVQFVGGDKKKQVSDFGSRA